MKSKINFVVFGLFLCLGNAAHAAGQSTPSAPINTDEENSIVFPIHLGKAHLADDLQKTIHAYQKMEDTDWVTVDKGSKLQKGDVGPRVLQVRQRLWATKDYVNKQNLDSDLFDDDLESAVKAFQLRHGLNADGVVGASTQKLMNFTLADVIHKMRVNLKRIEDLPEDFGPKFIFVNVADYRLSVTENAQNQLTMRTIVGKTKNKTPLFADEMEYVVLSPKWNVPQSITLKEISPKMQADPHYLEKRNYRIVPTGAQDPAVPFDASQIDWSNVNSQNLNFRLVKGSGGDNDLGFYKFIFPNDNSVYLHDTNSRRLFANEFRALSHGCVRISRPLDLAEYLLKDAGWTRETLEATARKGKEKFVTLPEKIPVHISYFTAWVDATGRLNLRDDIYNYDSKVILDEPDAEPDAENKKSD